ncbi:MAG: hypothetical protein ABJN26_05460 [Stappiaceae bacterium]
MIYLKNMGLLFAAILFSVIVAEFGLRILFPELNKPAAATRDHSDPLLPKQVSHKHKKLPNTANFDELGFRNQVADCVGSDVPAKRILLVGDSNIAATFLSDEDAPGNVLSKQLNSSNEYCYVVDSFGVSGFGPDQSLFAVRAKTDAAHYDHIVFHVFADNDLGDLVRNNNFFDNEKLENHGYCYVKPVYLDNFLLFKAIKSAFYKVFDYRIVSTYAEHSLGHSEKCSLPKYIDRYADPQKSFAQSLERSETEYKISSSGKIVPYMMNDRYDVSVACVADTAALEELQINATAIFKEFQEILDDRNIDGTILIQPSESDVTDNHPGSRGELARYCEKYNPRNISDFVLRGIQNSGYKGGVVDLYDTFENCSGCYFSVAELERDNHWNKHGVFVAMELLSKKIKY